MERAEIDKIMSEQLQTLADEAAECDTKELLPITQAMIAAAAFLIQLEQEY